MWENLMTTYVTIPDGDVDLDSPLNQPLLTALRDNPIALAEGDASVPATLRARVLLGTLVTTSGATQTLAGLVLAPYEFLHIVASSVAGSATAQLTIDAKAMGDASSATAEVFRGTCDLDLTSGIAVTLIDAELPATVSSTINSPRIVHTTYRNTTTSLVFGVSAGAFTAGSIRIYGVK